MSSLPPDPQTQGPPMSQQMQQQMPQQFALIPHHSIYDGSVMYPPPFPQPPPSHLPGMHMRSAESGDGSGDTPPLLKRPRVPKACEPCRKKKVRCDGSHPCSGCVLLPERCVYKTEERLRPTTYNKRHQLTQALVEAMSERMLKMERMMERLLERAGGSASSDDTEGSSLSEYGGGDASEKFLAIADACENQTPENAPPPTKGFTLLFPGEKLASHEAYISTHSPLSVYLPVGIQWLNQHVANPKNRISSPFVYNHTFTKYVVGDVNLWTDIIDKNEVVPLVPRPVFSQLLDAMCLCCEEANNVILRKDIDALLDRYFAESSRARPLRDLEHLVLYAILLVLMFSFLSGAFPVTPEIEGMLASLPPNTDQNMIKAACFYYLRVLVIGDGLMGVRGVLLLAMYAELTHHHHALGLLFAVATRLAQQIGLHKRELLIGLSEEELERRRLVWMMCEAYNNDMCLRFLQPPMTNLRDATMLLPRRFRGVLDEDLRQGWFMDPCQLTPLDKELPADAHRLLEKALLLEPLIGDGGQFMHLVAYHFVRLTHSTSDMQYLLTAPAGSGPAYRKHLSKDYARVMARLDRWRMLVAPEMRPGEPLNLEYYDTLQLGEFPVIRQAAALFLNCQYHFRVLCFSRMFLSHMFQANGSRLNKVLMIEKRAVTRGLDALRAIIRAVLLMELRNHSFFLAFAMPFFSAFVMCCMSIVCLMSAGLPMSLEGEAEQRRTLELLEEAVRDFISTHEGEPSGSHHKQYIMVKMQFFVQCMRTLLRVAVDVFDQKATTPFMTPAREELFESRTWLEENSVTVDKKKRSRRARADVEDVARGAGLLVLGDGLLVQSPASLAHLINQDVGLATTGTPASDSLYSGELNTGELGQQLLGEGWFAFPELADPRKKQAGDTDPFDLFLYFGMVLNVDAEVESGF